MVLDIGRLWRRRQPTLPAERPSGLGFIVGTGRCGTTILAQILNAHSKILVPPELQFIPTLQRQSVKQLRAREIASLIEAYCPYRLERFFDYRAYLLALDYPQQDLAVFLNNFFVAICRQYGKSAFLEQTPWYGQHLPMLAALFPEMHVIHMVRDPRDVVFSFQRTPFWGKITYEEGLRRWEKEVRVIREFGNTMGSRFVEIRYEDFVQAPLKFLPQVLGNFGFSFEETMIQPSSLFDYGSIFKTPDLGLTYHSPEYRRWRDAAGREAVFQDNVYAWKRRPEYSALYGKTECIAETMALYGYLP